jgi:hypothetical protein
MIRRQQRQQVVGGELGGDAAEGAERADMDHGTIKAALVAAGNATKI